MLAGRGDLYGDLGVIGANADGGYAEKCLAPASHVYRIPDSMPFDHAATFPTAYLTAATPCSTSASSKPARQS